MRSLMLTRQSESEVNGNFSKFQSKNMPDRIADEKKVVALMIRMYCRRHCRQQGHNGKTDQINRTDLSSQNIQNIKTDQFNQANKTDRTGNTNQADNSSRTDTSLLCPECATLLDYALRRLDSCRFGYGKPSCRKCPVHCYRADMRERIRTVMRWAGPRMIFRHPIAATRHLLRELRSPEPAK